MQEHSIAMVMASFAADALALGAHWIYDTDQLQREHGRIDEMLAPAAGSYHAGKRAGDFTHYGDQALALLRSLAGTGHFDINSFSRTWLLCFKEGSGSYVDRATAATLESMGRSSDPAGCGSKSTDLGGAARIAPLVHWYRDDLDQLLAAVRLQTAMTHNSTASLSAAEFLARAGHGILHGSTVEDALAEALEPGLADLDLDSRVRMAMDSAGRDTVETIRQMGQMCSATVALPGVVHLVLSYDGLEDALVANVMAGGDSAARGLAAGMLLGARFGPDSLPSRWVQSMQAGSEITGLLRASP